MRRGVVAAAVPVVGRAGLVFFATQFEIIKIKSRVLIFYDFLSEKGGTRRCGRTTSSTK
jgi:hypothetical protein